MFLRAEKESAVVKLRQECAEKVPAGKPLANLHPVDYTLTRTYDGRHSSERLPVHSGHSGALGRVRAAGNPILHRRACSGSGEVRETLGHPYWGGQAWRPAERTADALREKPGLGTAGKQKPHALDEHGVYTGKMPGYGRADDTWFPEGHCLGGVPLFQRAAGSGGHGVGAVLESDDLGARLSACLIFAYANLSLGRSQQARLALDELNAALSGDHDSPEVQAASGFVAAAGAVLLHLPLPEGLPDIQGFLPLLPPGLRAFALYVYAHFLYLQKEYDASLGLVEGALTMGAEQYPIPAIYLHLVAVMDAMSLKQTDRARFHLLAAWELARPDDLIEGLGEHHGLLGGMLEAVIKPKWPEDFKRIIEITYRFSSGWRRVHNPITGHDVADDLTTTEFAVCMLAARGWSSQDIAELLHISVSTVKNHIAAAKEKLGVSHRKDLKQYMLQ